jgi:WhiB family transcriptional regulator, redox-sensing transcriptional regulator
LAVTRTHVLVRVGAARTTVVPTQNLSSSSAQITVAPSPSSTTTSSVSTGMQWQSAAALFSALSLVEGTGSYSQNPTIMNWFLVDSHQILPGIYERVNPQWQAGAKCHGLPGNLFYADSQHNNGQVQEAKSVCLGTHPDHPGRCPVLEACLDYAIENGERWGVWGGTSERERRRIKRQRHRDAAIQAGKVISITSGDRQEFASVVRNDEASHPTPWRCSKALIDAWRARRDQNRRPASL